LQKKETGYHLILIFILLLTGIVQAEDNSSGKAAAGADKKTHFRLEVKRQNTNRGSAEEKTQTQIKFSVLLDRSISLVRLQIPFPDDKSSFEGDPFSPRLGDIKLRFGFRQVSLGNLSLGSFFEITFPTANPEDLGSGKYQLSPGIQTSIPFSFDKRWKVFNKMSFGPAVKQVFSVAGDDDRKDINYTRFDLSLKDTSWKKYWLKLTEKIVVDWEQSAKTGSVVELEGGTIIKSHWRIWLLLGARLWGKGVPSTYDQRVELNASVDF